MLKNYFLFTITFSLFVYGNIYSQLTYVPDDSFEQQLIDKGYDDVLDDYVLTSNIEEVLELTLDDRVYNYLNDMTGIEDFRDLEKFIILDAEELDMLDLSNNIALKYLGIASSNFRIVDISGNVNLEELSITGFTGFNTIDLSNCVKLERIRINGNDMENLDLKHNPNLKSILLDEVTHMKTLDLSANALLETISFITVSQLNSLDLSHNINLKGVGIQEGGLQSLNIKSGNNENIESFNVSEALLECVQVDSEAYSNANWGLDYGYFSENCSTFGLTYIPDDAFEQTLIYKGLDDVLDDYVLTSNIINVEGLLLPQYVSDPNPDGADFTLIDLTGIEDFEALSDFTMQSNYVATVNMEKNTALTKLSLTEADALTTLNLTKNTALKTLLLKEARNLLSIDLTNNTSLTALSILAADKLTDINLTKNTALTSVDFSYNEILSNVDLKNGNNMDITLFNSISNPLLNCIQIDDADWSTTNWTNVDPWTSFSEDCTIFGLTYVPDDVFEQQLIDKGYDDVRDDYVLTSNIIEVKNLKIFGEYYSPHLSSSTLKDMTGIEDFRNLEEFNFSENAAPEGVKQMNLSSLNKLKYLKIYFDYTLNDLILPSNGSLEELYLVDARGLKILNTDSCVNLKTLSLSEVHIEQIDLTKNLKLEHIGINEAFEFVAPIDFTKNTLLKSAGFFTTNLEQIDLSKNVNLEQFRGESLPYLIKLDLKNGNNYNMNPVTIKYSILTCVQVDDAEYSTINWTNVEPEITFSEDCSTFGLTYIPDDNFEQALIDLEYDNILDDYVVTSNISSVTSLDVSSENISALTGIEDFISLQNLYLSNNFITSIDLSNNESLTRLVIENNGLTNLDLSSNINLDFVECSFNKISSINTEGATKLQELRCSYNEIASLDLTSNKILNTLYIDDNNLSSINVSGLTLMTALDLNKNNLASIDLTSLTSLSWLNVIGNNLTELDITKNVKMDELWCHSNNISSLDLTQNINLTEVLAYENDLVEFNIQNGGNSKILSLEVQGNSNLTCMQVDNAEAANAGIGVYGDWYKDADVIYSLDCSLEGLTFVPDDNFEQELINLGYDDVLDDYVITANISGVTSLFLYNKNIKDLTGIEDFQSLVNLDCGSNQLTSLDVSQNVTLTTLLFGSNQLTSIDVSENTNLINLQGLSNKITSLDVSKNTKLDNLQFGDNQIASLDVSNNTKLVILSIDFNQLNSLDVSNNNQLKVLGFDYNQITNINVGNNINLRYLYGNNNQLTNLDISKNVVLEHLYCNDNQLTSLNVKNGNNSLITIFNVSNNRSLACIQVDDETDANNKVAPYNNWVKDATATYSENCSALGINDEILNQTLNLYPNPVSEILSVESRLPLKSIEIYNLLGQEIKIANDDFESINLNDLSRGIYMIRINSENGSSVRKLIKQ